MKPVKWLVIISEAQNSSPEMLDYIFRHKMSYSAADKMMLKNGHNKILGSYTKDIAETITGHINDIARRRGESVKAIIEQDWSCNCS